MIAEIPSGPLAFDVFSDSSRSVTSFSSRGIHLGSRENLVDIVQMSCHQVVEL